MIVAKFFSSASELAQHLRGSTVRAESNTGASTGSTTTFLDDNVDFSDSGVIAGDTVYVSGEGTFLVSSVAAGASGAITLDSALSATDQSGLSYRIVETDTIVDPNDILYLGQHTYDNTRWDLLYASNTFKVKA